MKVSVRSQQDERMQYHTSRDYDVSVHRNQSNFGILIDAVVSAYDILSLSEVSVHKRLGESDYCASGVDGGNDDLLTVRLGSVTAYDVVWYVCACNHD